MRTLATEGLLGPNDVAVSTEGTVFFTDPGHFPPASERPGRIMAYDADHGLRGFAADFVYCNGIVCEPAGTIVEIGRAHV